MRRIVVTEFVSLDGVMEEPRWTFEYWNDEIAKFKGEESSASDALLLGRVTYQGFAAAWPQSKAEGADYFNNVRKYVVSETLEEPLEWNNSTLIKDNIVEQITNLKRQEGKDIAVHGSATLVQTPRAARSRGWLPAPRLPGGFGQGQAPVWGGYPRDFEPSGITVVRLGRRGARLRTGSPIITATRTTNGPNAPGSASAGRRGRGPVAWRDCQPPEARPLRSTAVAL